MATSKLITHISSIAKGHSQSIAQLKSDSGKFLAQRRGPFLFNFTIQLQVMSDKSDQYYDVEEALNGINYGVGTITTQLPATEVSNRGTWAGTPRVNLGSQTGTSLNLDGFNANVTGIIKSGDWVQFTGDTKVYQVTEDVDSNADGEVTIKLNTPLIKSPADNTVIATGNSVEFKLALTNPDSIGPSKRAASSTYNIATWGVLELQEVL